MDDRPIGPNPCSVCFGEYGAHQKDCRLAPPPAAPARTWIDDKETLLGPGGFIPGPDPHTAPAAPADVDEAWERLCRAGRPNFATFSCGDRMKAELARLLAGRPTPVPDDGEPVTEERIKAAWERYEAFKQTLRPTVPDAMLTDALAAVRRWENIRNNSAMGLSDAMQDADRLAFHVGQLVAALGLPAPTPAG